MRIGDPAADQVACRHAEAEQRERDRDPRFTQHRDIGDERTDERVHGEDARDTERRDEHRDPDGRLAQRAELGPPRSASVRGTHIHRATQANAATPATVKYVLRQPRFSPRKVARGEPMMVATVSPVMTIANAFPPWPGPTMYEATTAPAPK